LLRARVSDGCDTETDHAVAVDLREFHVKIRKILNNGMHNYEVLFVVSDLAQIKIKKPLWCDFLKKYSAGCLRTKLPNTIYPLG
jgi:hypothetical protein